MDDIQILIEFIRGLLGDESATAALALIPVILAVVGLTRQVPWVEQRKRWVAPLLAVALGLAGGVYVAGPTLQGVLAGLLAALGAVGAHSAGKNLRQATN